MDRSAKGGGGRQEWDVERKGGPEELKLKWEGSQIFIPSFYFRLHPPIWGRR